MMLSNNQQKTLILIVILVAVLYGLNLLSPYLTPFFAAWLAAYLFDPMVDKTEQLLRIRQRSLAICVSLTALLLVVFGLWWLFGSAVYVEISGARQLIDEYRQSQARPDWLPEDVGVYIKEILVSDEVRSLLTFDSVSPYFGAFAQLLGKGLAGIGSLASAALGLLLFVVYFIFILFYFHEFKIHALAYVPASFRESLELMLSDVEKEMRGYFRGQSKIVFIVAILFAVSFKLIGLPLAIVFGIFVGVLNFIPYVQLFALIPALFLAFLQSLQTGTPFWQILLLVLAVFVVVQLIQDFYLTPRIMKDATGLNPAIMLLALSVWGGLLGAIGLIIALPGTSLIANYYKRFLWRVGES